MLNFFYSSRKSFFLLCFPLAFFLKKKNQAFLFILFYLLSFLLFFLSFIFLDKKKRGWFSSFVFYIYLFFMLLFLFYFKSFHILIHSRIFHFLISLSLFWSRHPILYFFFKFLFFFISFNSLLLYLDPPLLCMPNSDFDPSTYTDVPVVITQPKNDPQTIPASVSSVNHNINNNNYNNNPTILTRIVVVYINSVIRFPVYYT